LQNLDQEVDSVPLVELLQDADSQVHISSL
jgi:hypothetical protein